ncbi:hypothetical protein [Solicola sp. PLA-1-18]|uniref:hypothetical protein n=1 Tax=Solicola sp. PLA-1-18 TaxID=3380532 RepID=UPI003B7E9FCA
MTRVLTPGRIVLLVLLAAVLVVPAVLTTDRAQAQLGELGLTDQGTAFTELSIKQYADLAPLVKTRGEVDFDALVTNRSDGTARYTWSATAGPSGDEKVVDGGRFELAAGDTTELPVSLRIADCSQRNRVAVKVSTPDQRSPEVHFWVLPRGSVENEQSGGPSCVAS